MALTATASQETRGTILEHLGIDDDCAVFCLPPARINLRYKVCSRRGGGREDVKKNLVPVLTKYSREKGIVYCRTPRTCDEVAFWLRCQSFVMSLILHLLIASGTGHGIRAQSYHSKLSDAKKSAWYVSYPLPIPVDLNSPLGLISGCPRTFILMFSWRQ